MARPILKTPFKGQRPDFETYSALVENTQDLIKNNKNLDKKQKYRNRFAKIVSDAGNSEYEAVEVAYIDTGWTEVSGGYRWSANTVDGYKTFNTLTTLNGETIATNTIVEVVCEPRQTSEWHPLYTSVYVAPVTPVLAQDAIYDTYLLNSNVNNYTIELNSSDFRGRHIESWLWNESNNTDKVTPIVTDYWIEPTLTNNAVIMIDTDVPQYQVYINKTNGTLHANASSISVNRAIYWIRTSEYVYAPKDCPCRDWDYASPSEGFPCAGLLEEYTIDNGLVSEWDTEVISYATTTAVAGDYSNSTEYKLINGPYTATAELTGPGCTWRADNVQYQRRFIVSGVPQAWQSAFTSGYLQLRLWVTGYYAWEVLYEYLGTAPREYFGSTPTEIGNPYFVESTNPYYSTKGGCIVREAT
jgi:hypothetical protein